jgi:hypothetical protein
MTFPFRSLLMAALDSSTEVVPQRVRAGLPDGNGCAR